MPPGSNGFRRSAAAGEVPGLRLHPGRRAAARVAAPGDPRCRDRLCRCIGIRSVARPVLFSPLGVAKGGVPRDASNQLPATVRLACRSVHRRGGRPDRKARTFHLRPLPQLRSRLSEPAPDVDRIGDYYDDEYIAHRKKRNWGVLTPLYERAMNKRRRQGRARPPLRRPRAGSRVLDVGCAVGTFLAAPATRTARVTGVDFKDLSTRRRCATSSSTAACSTSRTRAGRFDLVTLWHFLEHDYDPCAASPPRAACSSRAARS